jgi:ATP-dependent 26S proteasome regulatory subunit
MSRLPADDLQWALQRRLEDVFAKLGEKFGDLTGRVETEIQPTVTFEEVGGLGQAKTLLRGFALALTSPDSYARWGVPPPKGILLYGPPGTGKSKLTRALATAAGAIFFHVKLLNLTSKFGANTGELLQEILRIAGGEGRAVLFLDEAEALSLEHLLPPPAAREASARLVAALCEKLDGLPPTGRVLVVGATSRTDAVDAELVAPGRLDHLVEVPLPDADAQREILDLMRARAERNAGRPLFEPDLDYRKMLPVMGGMSGADIAEIIRRALEGKVHQSAEGAEPGPVTTDDLLISIDAYKRVRGVVEKIRYGQYL